MEIKNSIAPISFGTKVRTAKILEACTLKYTESDSIADLRPIIDTFWHKPLKAAGNRGYRYYIKDIAEKIMQKYPEIKQASEDILRFAASNPEAKRPQMREFVKPIIQKLGEEIDISI